MLKPLVLLLLSVSVPLTHASCKGINCNSVQLSDPCVPSPCGPNTWCQLNPRDRNIAQCRCLDGFVPDDHTIKGCKPQCMRDDDCSDNYRCQRTKCVRVCGPGACGMHAHCEADDHQSKCTCPAGYSGDPYRFCRRNVTSQQLNEEPRRPPPHNPTSPNPCHPDPCGANAQCRPSTSFQRAICYCPHGYQGNPMLRCNRGECIESLECPRHLACQRMQCINPCNLPNICGQNAECSTINHVPTCSCPRGFIGNPLNSCRRFFPQELCDPSPCGSHTSCNVSNNRAVCSCSDGYIGNPLVACRPECERHSDCPLRMACEANRCVNPCKDACGPGAYCDVQNGRAVCSCPMFYKGDPKMGCYPECQHHSECPSFQACYQLQCVDPCVGACGTDAICKVENHQSICSCPKGYTGHPFEHCRPFTDADLCRPNPCGTNAECNPGLNEKGEKCPICSCPRGYIGNALISCERGDCEIDNHCPHYQACYYYTCQDPCYYNNGKSVCGTNANCQVRNHRPVCSCPRGYFGDARTGCYERSRELPTNIYPAQTTMQPHEDINVPAQTILQPFVPAQRTIQPYEDISVPAQTTLQPYVPAQTTKLYEVFNVPAQSTMKYYENIVIPAQ